MNKYTYSLIVFVFTVLPVAVKAETTPASLEALPWNEVYGAAEVTPVVLDNNKQPVALLLKIEEGSVVPPHGGDSTVLRLLTVVSGDLSWGDGEVVDEAAETIYSAGSILMLPAGTAHWVAARSGDVLVQVMVIRDTQLSSALEEQMP